MRKAPPGIVRIQRDMWDISKMLRGVMAALDDGDVTSAQINAQAAERAVEILTNVFYQALGRACRTPGCETLTSTLGQVRCNRCWCLQRDRVAKGSRGGYTKYPKFETVA